MSYLFIKNQFQKEKFFFHIKLKILKNPIKPFLVGFFGGFFWDLGGFFIGNSDIRQSLPPDSLLEMDCSVVEGQLAWWTTGACHPIVHREAGLRILILLFLSKCVLSTNRNILYVDRTLVRMSISTISNNVVSETKQNTVLNLCVYFRNSRL
jgi:hypothetical protein